MSDSETNYTYVTAEWIRRPLADLGGISPTDAAADPRARKKLEDLLTELAGHYVRLTNLGLPAIDPGELRRVLGIEAAAAAPARGPARNVRTGPVKRSPLLDELGTALTGGDVDSVAFFNIKTGAVEHFMHNLGDQETARIAQAQTDAEMRKVSPVTTEVRYGIMSDFIAQVEDINVAGRLRASISGKGAFRRFREAVDEDDSLRRRWLSYRTKRHYLLAFDWLHKLELKPEQYGLNPGDYDWHPPAAQPQHPAEAESLASVAEPEAVMEGEGGGVHTGQNGEPQVAELEAESTEPKAADEAQAEGEPAH